MPPASLSTFEVMRPGPTTARNSAMRRRNGRRRRLISLPRTLMSANVRSIVTQVFILLMRALQIDSRRKQRSWPPAYECYAGSAHRIPTSECQVLQPCVHATDYVVDRNRADRAVVCINDCEAAQIILIEQLKHFLFVGIRAHRDDRLETQFIHALFGTGNYQTGDRNRAGECAIVVDEDDVVELVRDDFVEAYVINHLAAGGIFPDNH